jgi:hypothetical protein
MNLGAMLRRQERAARRRTVLKIVVVLLALGWLLHPRGLVFQHAGEGVAAASSWLQGAAITALGGTRADPGTAKSPDLDSIVVVNGYPAAEVRCLALAIYHESGREKPEAQIALGRLILNRAIAGKAPRALCSVVYQGLGTPAGCQFAASCRQVGTMPAPGARLAQAIETALGLAAHRIGGGALQEATHFHDSATRPPVWTRKLQRLGASGNLVFYGPLPPADEAGEQAQQDAGAAATPSVRKATSRPAEPAAKPGGSMDSREMSRVFGLH